MDVATAAIHQTQTTSTNQQPTSTSSTGPQIRSRITVVCAECKRLKLKCDRRAPCGSCTKRDTVVRCIYSPAAAEKVDLHSLNNRLIQVEAILAIITAGQTPPAFQSVYPFSYPSAATTAPSSSSNLPSSFTNSHHGSHQHHHHYAAPSSHSSVHDSIMLSPQDFASIWLDDLDLGVSWLSPSFHQRPFVDGASSGYIKLEPSSIDLELHNSSNNGPQVIDVDNSSHFSNTRSSTPHGDSPHPRSQQRSLAQLLLPALSIYYPVPSISPPGTSPSSSSAFPHQPSSSTYPSPTNASSSLSHNFSPHPQYTKPQVTPALLALLPPLPRCKHLLQRAHDVLRVRPIPFEPVTGSRNGWKGFESRCLTLLGGGVNEERERERERKEKAREARRQRQIYFGGIAGLQPQPDDAERDHGGGGRGGGGSKENVDEQYTGEAKPLTFFATMCSVLAIGAFSSPSSSGESSPLGMGASSSTTTESAAFFYSLSQQALGVWDTHTSSSGSSTSGSAAADEAERMDYLLACLVGVEYLLLSGSSSSMAGERERDSEHGPIYALVGKLVNASRAMGLGRDSSSGRKNKTSMAASDTGVQLGRPTNKKAEKERAKEEWRRMVLWQVMFYDLFTADALGHQPYIPSYSYSTKLPSCSSHFVAVPWDSADGEHDSEDERQLEAEFGHMQHDGYEFTTRNTNRRRRQSSIFNSTANANGTVTSELDEDAYLGARYRLTQLAQAVKNRIAHPDCCCGYTLDQAASLEDEIRRWQSGLPLSLRSPSEPSTPASPFHDLLPNGSESTDKALHAQHCELAVMANLLVVKIYTPFLRHAAASGTALAAGSSNSNSLQVPPSSSANVSPAPASISASASQATLYAAQIIIRAAKALQAAPSISSSTNTSDGSSPVKVLPSMFDFYPLEKVVFDAVVICAHVGLTGKATMFAFDSGALIDDIPSGLALLSDLCVGPGIGLGDKQKRVVEALYKRVMHRGGNVNLLKRKHDQVDLNMSGAFGASTGYLSANGAAGGSNGETMMSGFDFTNTSGQYQPNGLPIAQQQHPGLMDMSSSTTSTSRSSVPPSASISIDPFPQDQLQRSEQQKKALTSALTSVAAVRLSAAAAARNAEKEKQQEQDQHEKEKSQKHSKKSHVYPSVGIRVRSGKEASLSNSRSRTQSVSGPPGVQHPPLMTSTPRPLPSAESVLAYQQQHKQKMQAIALGPGPDSPTGNEGDAQRSRSSSFSHLQSEQQQQQQRQRQPSDPDYPLPFAPLPPPVSDVMDSLAMHGKRISVHDPGARQQQQQHQQHSQHSPYSPRVFDQGHAIYDQSQQPYDTGPASSMPQTDRMSYNAVSSPFSNSGGPPSSSGSPFASTSVASSGQPSTPSFNAHHPTPPVFGPQPPPSASPTTYFHSPNPFSGPYTQSPSSSNPPSHHQSISLGDIGLDQAMVPGTPVYDKSQQQQASMYDVKPGLDDRAQHHHLLQQQHQSHMPRQQMAPPNSYEDQDMPGQLSMGMARAPPWPPSNQQHPQSGQTAQNYWDNGAGFRFYS